MQHSAPKKATSRPRSFGAFQSILFALAFFVPCFLYVWLRIEPSLQYHESAPVFFYGASFFQPFLNKPGGLVEYAAAFLSQWSYYDWLGAMVFVGLSSVVYGATRRLLGKPRELAVRMLSFMPLFLLLLLDSCNGFPVLNIALGLLAALGLMNLYQALNWNVAWRRLAVFWCFTWLIFYLGGLVPCALFAVLGGIYETTQRRQRGLGIGCALSLLGPMAWMAAYPNTPWAGIWESWGSGWPSIAAAALHLFFPLAVLATALIPDTAERPKETTGSKSGKIPPTRLHKLFQSGAFQAVMLAMYFVAGWTLVWRAFDVEHKSTIQISRYAAEKQWDKILALVSEMQTINLPSQICLMQALFHTGRLPQDMLAFPISENLDYLTGFSADTTAYRLQSETMLELGNVNMAEHFAHEAFECQGDRPEILKLLVRIHILKGRPQAARIFLNRLAQAPFQGDWARHYLSALAANPALPEDLDLAQIRLRMPVTDMPHIAVSADAVLQQLLHDHPTNRMAFEYMMANHLIGLEMDRITQGIEMGEVFGEKEIPRLYEEAILLSQRMKGGQELEWNGRKIRAGTIQRFRQFSDAIQSGANKTKEGSQALSREFGDTFWHLYLTRHRSSNPPAAKPESAP